MIELATASYRAYRPEMGIACRITVGRPPAWFRHEHEEIRALAPPRKVLAIADQDWEGFRKAYRNHLYRQTPQRLRTIFEEISERHDGARLVLLCFEADPADCHRGEFSRWYQRQTGQEVPELPAIVAQPALFGEEEG